MDCDVQPSEPAAQLLVIAAEVTPGWIRRVTLQAAAAEGFGADALAPSLEAMVESESLRLFAALRQLLATDVDQQRTNPLSLFRDAVAAPTALLRSIGVPVPQPDQFSAERFPDDVYALGPAAWSDIDPRLHEPGLVWGAWKAMTILRRRRAEGVR